MNNFEELVRNLRQKVQTESTTDLQKDLIIKKFYGTEYSIEGNISKHAGISSGDIYLDTDYQVDADFTTGKKYKIFLSFTMKDERLVNNLTKYNSGDFIRLKCSLWSISYFPNEYFFNVISVL